MALLSQISFALASDWPKWRGPTGDGVARFTNLPENWPDQGLQPRWRAPIGKGYAGVVVSNGLALTMDRTRSEKGKTPDGNERVLCFDAASGNLRWSHEYDAQYGELGGYANGPRAAPTIEGGRIYTLGAVGMVCCLDARSGRVIWSRDTVAEMGAKIPEWGFAASPVIVDDLVVVHVAAQPGGSLVAFNKTSGKEVWRSLDDPAGYCTPILIQSPSGPQLVIWTPENVCGLDPKSGAKYWSVPYKVTYAVSIATPIYDEGIVFVSGYWEGSKAIRLGERLSDAELIWTENRYLRGLMAPPLYRDGLVFSLDKQHGLTCFELKTGNKLWDDGNRMTPRGRNPQATFVWTGSDDRVLALNSEGELILARFTPDGYQEDARAKIIGPTWANPAFAGNCVYARDEKEIICVPVSRESAAAP